MKFTIVVAYTFNTDWLKKTREQRKRFEEENVSSILAKYSNEISMKFYDAECFETEFSDFMVIETESLDKYYYMFEELRDSSLVAEGYVTFNQIFMGIEDGYIQFEKHISGG